jgi:hypothetical protein
MRLRKRDEQGIAMVMTVIIIVVAAALVALVLYQGSSTERHSGRGANWNEAGQAADAGVEEAIARLQGDQGVAPASALTGTTAEGSYKTTVQNLGRRRYQIDSIGTSGNVQGLKTERHIRVIMAPPRSFKYALFSLSDLSTKNRDTINGDIWANGSVIVEANDFVYGDVTAATGYLTMETGSYIEGNVQTGGYNASGTSMQVEKIQGNVTASSTSPGCFDDPGHGKYSITGGTISGNATTWAASVGSSVSGTVKAKTCTLAPATKPIPSFTYNPLNYDPAPTEWASVADFQTYLNAFGTNFSGVHFVHGTGMIDLTGVTITGDAAIIAENATIWANGVSSANNNDKLFVLVSFAVADASDVCTDGAGNPDDCVIGMKNGFTAENNTATLLYAPNGPIGFKNAAEFVGAAYAANIVLKNTMVVTWDERIQSIVGFGPVTLQRDSYIEISQ